MYFITGDRHGDFRDLKAFAQKHKTTTDDVMIILGDAGINYYVEKDPSTGLYKNKGALTLLKKLKRLPLTLVIIQGNHEAPAWCCDYMETREMFGGTVFFHKDVPNVVFLKNAEIYSINNHDCLVLGGAFSVDKNYREPAVPGAITRRFWFPEEQMTEEEYQRAEDLMEARNNQIDTILSHTCPYSVRPVEFFLKGADWLAKDDTQEQRFEEFKNKWDFNRWWFGHYHGNKVDGKFICLYEDIREFD